MNARKTTLTNLCRFLLATIPWILPLVLIATILCPVSLEQWMESWSQFNDIATHLLDSMTTATINLSQQTIVAFLSAFHRFNRIAIPCSKWITRTTTSLIQQAIPVCSSAFLLFNRIAIPCSKWITHTTTSSIQQAIPVCSSAFLQFNRIAIRLLVWNARTIIHLLQRAIPVCLRVSLQFSTIAIRALAWTTLATIKVTHGMLLIALRRYTEPTITFHNNHATWSQEDETRVIDILEQLNCIPAVHKLISDSFNRKGVHVYFREPEVMFAAGSCSPVRKAIYLRNNLPIVNAIITLIFEMCNASHLDDFPLVSECESADAFAFETEVVEYQSAVRFVGVLNSVVSTSILKLFTAEEVRAIEERIAASTRTWERYWECANVAQADQPHSHAKNYRKSYRRRLNNQKVCIFPLFSSFRW